MTSGAARQRAERVLDEAASMVVSHGTSLKLAADVLVLLDERDEALRALSAAPEPNDITEDELIRAYVTWFHGRRHDPFQMLMRRMEEAR